MEITNINQLDPLYGVYSYADYLLWKFKERVELFKGKLFKTCHTRRIIFKSTRRK